jgi:hypothetical protein
LDSRGFKVQRTGGEGKKEDGFCLVRAEGEPERSESPREQKAPPRSKTSGGKGHGFWVGVTRRSTGPKPEGFGGKCRGERERGDPQPTTQEEEGSEGESPRALEVERDLQGIEELRPPRG